MRKYDHYQEAASLIAILQNTSLKSYGDALQGAMDQGSTGTEIFMALMWNLEKLLKENDCKDLIKAKASRLWKELNKVLQ